MAQHDHLLSQRVGAIEVLLQAAGGKAFAADALQPLTGLRGVPARFGIAAQIAQYRTRLDRGQLVLVTQQHQSGMFG